MNEKDHITERCREALNTEVSLNNTLKMQTAIDQALETVSAAPPRPVMTLHEVANYLRVTPDDVAQHLEQIPCFEFAGKLLFRKDAIDEWITAREQKYAGELQSFHANRIIHFNIA